MPIAPRLTLDCSVAIASIKLLIAYLAACLKCERAKSFSTEIFSDSSTISFWGSSASAREDFSSSSTSTSLMRMLRDL